MIRSNFLKIVFERKRLCSSFGKNKYSSWSLSKANLVAKSSPARISSLERGESKFESLQKNNFIESLSQKTDSHSKERKRFSPFEILSMISVSQESILELLQAYNPEMSKEMNPILTNRLKEFSQLINDAIKSSYSLLDISQVIECCDRVIDALIQERDNYGELLRVVPMEFLGVALKPHDILLQKLCRYNRQLMGDKLQSLRYSLNWIKTFKKLCSFPSFFCVETIEHLIQLISKTATLHPDNLNLGVNLLTVYNLIREKGIVIRRETYESLIYAYALSQDQRRSKICLELIRRAKGDLRITSLSIESYKFALKSCCNLGINLEIPNEIGYLLYDEILAEAMEDVGPSAQIYEGMMKAMLDRPNKNYLVKDYYLEMRENNIRPNIYTCNHVLRFCYFRKDYELSATILNHMKEYEILPSKFTYHNLMLLARKHSLEMTENVLSQYLAHFGSLDINICNIWIGALLRYQRKSQAFSFLKTMKALHNLNPSEVTIYTLMSPFCLAGTSNCSVTCRKIFSLISLFRIPLECEMYAKLTRSYINDNLIDEAEETFNLALDHYRCRGLCIPDNLSILFIQILQALERIPSSQANFKYYLIVSLAETYYQNRPYHQSWISHFRVKQLDRGQGRMSESISAIKKNLFDIYCPKVNHY